VVVVTPKLHQGNSGGGDTKLLFNGYRVSSWDDEEVLKTNSGDDYARVPIYLMPLKCALKNS
jgi:hypothetical protein